MPHRRAANVHALAVLVLVLIDGSGEGTWGRWVSENMGRCKFRNSPQEQEGELTICEAE